jgi:tight adherence protein C
MSPVVLIIAAAVVLLLAGAATVMLHVVSRQDRIAARIRALHGEQIRPAAGMDAKALRGWTVRAVSGFGQWILNKGLLPARTLGDLQQSLALAGLRGGNALSLFIGSKILLAVTLPLVAWVLGKQGLVPSSLSGIMPIVAGAAGLLLPDWLLKRQRKACLKRLEAGLPDALDMLVICAQAGIGLGPAIVKVGEELANAHPDISREFRELAHELHVTADARIPLANLGRRTGLDGFKRFAASLIQTQQYGTPVSDALRVLSAEMRQETLTRFEARAARLGVLLTMPMIGFILPCVFMVGGGPAVIQLMRGLGHH